MRFIEYFVDRMWEYLAGFFPAAVAFELVQFLIVREYITNPAFLILTVTIFCLIFITGSIWLHWKAHGLDKKS